jgi:hypothetical protein
LLVANAHALGLGELQLRSYVGQHLRATIPFRLSDTETLSDDCITISNSNGDLPSIGPVEPRIRGNNIVLEGSENISEPTGAFSLHINCGRVIYDRDFVVLLDPPPEVEPAIVTPIAERRAPSEERPPVTTAATPPKRKASKAVPVADATQKPASKPVHQGASGARPAQPERDVLRIQGDSLPPLTLPATPGSPEYARELEQRVATLKTLQGKLEADIVTLQTTLDALKKQQAASPAQDQTAARAALPAAQANASAPVAAPAMSAAPQPTAAAAPAPTAVPVPTAAPVPVRSSQGGLPLWPLGVLAAALAGALFMWWRQRRNDAALAADLYADTMIGKPVNLGVTLQRKLTQASGFINSQLSPTGIEVKEAQPDLDERAQMLLLQGEVTAAIEELQRGIADAPDDVERWFLLFRIFRHQGMKIDYAQLARDFKVKHPDDEDWELVRNIGQRLDPENPLYAQTTPAAASPLDSADLELIAPLAAAAAAVPRAGPTPSQHEPVLDFLSDSAGPVEPRLDEAAFSAPPHIDLELPDLGGGGAIDKPGSPSQPVLLDEIDFDPPRDKPHRGKKH